MNQWITKHTFYASADIYDIINVYWINLVWTSL